MYQTSCSSPLGTIILISHLGKLIYCNWDSSDCCTKLNKIRRYCFQNSYTGETYYHSLEPMRSDIDVIQATIRQLVEYFSGLRKDFNLPIELIGSDFQKTVWKNLALIPYGTTITYKELAKKCKKEKAHRAIAAACGANPLSIILPCHRVISASRGAGGYTGGIDKKLWLLSFEKPKDIDS